MIVSRIAFSGISNVSVLLIPEIFQEKLILFTTKSYAALNCSSRVPIISVDLIVSLVISDPEK